MAEQTPVESEVWLTVLEEYGGGAIRLPLSKLEIVRQRLDQGAINYWVDGTVIRKPGREPIYGISISRNADMELARKLIDDLL